MKKYYSILFAFLLIPTLCVAADKPPQVIADSWVMMPKAGQNSEFKDALKAHLAFRVEKGDTRHWDVYVPVTGKHLNRYVVRSCCDTWAEQDSYRMWTKENLGDHFNETVDPHVESYAHNFTEIDMQNSHWGKGVVANYVGVTNWSVKQGKYNQAKAAISEMSTMAKKNNWAYNWSWTYPVGGPAEVMLATPYKNFADMAPLEESFYQFAKKHMGADEADEMFEKFSGSFDSNDYSIWRRHHELSMKRNDEK